MTANTITIKTKGEEDGELFLSGVKNNNPPSTKVATAETITLFINFIKITLFLIILRLLFIIPKNRLFGDFYFAPPVRRR